MLSRKFATSITKNERAIRIGIALSKTNEQSAISYLQGEEIRYFIENKTSHSNDNKYQDGVPWVIQEFSTHWNAMQRRKRK